MSTLIKRVGNKDGIANLYLPYIPEHTIYIEPFFGAGGMFFNKPKAKHNFLNDLDSDVYNLWHVLSDKELRRELIKQFKLMPIHEDILMFFKKNEVNCPIKKALRFLFLSNNCLYGKPDNLKFHPTNRKNIALSLMKISKTLLNDCQFSNCDFRRFFKQLGEIYNRYQSNAFIFADPPYLKTTDNYSASFTEQDSIDLFDCLMATGCKFAYCEFDNPFIIEQAKQRGLFVHYITERQALKARRTEILITNYPVKNTLF